MTDELASRRGPWVPAVHRALREGVESGYFPGGACAIYRAGTLLHLSATGQAQETPTPLPARTETVYDLASVTKVLCTTALCAVHAGKGALAVDDLVRKHLPEAARAGKGALTLRDLLAHRSGLPAWKPYFTLAQADPGSAPLFPGPATAPACRRGKAVVTEAVLAEPPERPAGQAAVYSDVGFILLGLALEAVGSAPLEEQAQELIYRPLGLQSLHFRPLVRPRLLGSAAATGLRRPREPAAGQEALYSAGPENTRVGEVDDDNAYAMGGVAGHAGLFGAAADVGRLGMLILEDLEGAGRMAPPEVWARFAERDATPGSTRALGFDTPSDVGSTAGTKLGRAGPKGALGHTGFTGTSLWLDRDRQLAVALLTNRVHPTRAREGIKAFRPAFHDAVIEALEQG